MAKITHLQWKEGKLGSGDFTDSNNLAQALMTQPEIYKTLAYAFGDKYYLQYLTAGSGRVADKYKALGNNEYIWPMMGDLTKPIAITGACVGNGLGFSTFTAPLAEKYFFEGCVVHFGDEHIQARQQGDAVQVGNDWITTFKLVTDDAAAFVPATLLVSGNLVSYMYTAYEEGSRGGGSFEAYPFWFKNQMTTLRMSYGMTGEAATDIMILEMGDEKGSKSNLWMYASDYQKMLVWQQMVERYRWYGTYNKTPQGEIHLKGANGRPVSIGDGVLNQIADTNVWNYGVLTNDLMNDFLTDLLVASKDAENKKLMMFTGIGGIRQFQDSILAAYSNVQIVDTTFVSKNGMGMSFDNQSWTTYKGILNTEITVVHNPLYDDRTFHTQLHPDTGLPLESYRMTFLDFSDYAGEPNISLVTKGKDGDNRAMRMWYTAGAEDPYGSKNTGANKIMRSSSLDGFECFYLSQQGIKVTNPLACGELKLVVG
jgi:hypothetical protein